MIAPIAFLLFIVYVLYATICSSADRRKDEKERLEKYGICSKIMQEEILITEGVSVEGVEYLIPKKIVLQRCLEIFPYRK
jgi:hypothetical protein